MNNKYISIILLIAYLTSLTSSSYAGLWDDIKQGTRDVNELSRIINNILPKEDDDTHRKSPSVQKEKPVIHKNNSRTQYTYNQDFRLVKDVQNELTRIGYPVSIDGAYGPGTRKAILQFEVDNGHVQTGNVSPKLFAKLKEAQPGFSPKSKHKVESQTEQQPRLIHETPSLNNEKQAKGSDTKQTTKQNQWAITVHIEHKGQSGILAKGGAVLDENGIPTQLAISYILPQIEARLQIFNQRTYISAGKPGTQFRWLDLSEPVGRLSSSIPMPTIPSVTSDYQESGELRVESERYRIFEKEKVSIRIDDETIITSKDSYWKDKSNVIRRYISNVQFQIQGKVFNFVSVMKQVKGKVLPGWYIRESNRAYHNSIPAASVLRSVIHSRTNQNVPTAQLPFSRQYFSISRFFTPMLDFLIPRVQADNQIEKDVTAVLAILGASQTFLTQASAIDALFIKSGLHIYPSVTPGMAGFSMPLLMQAAVFLTVAAASFYITGRLVEIITSDTIGEPHITSFDKYRYNFQAVGEFIQVKTPTFMVQQRFEGSKGRNTSTKATAIRAGNHVIESYLPEKHDPSAPLFVAIDGSVVEVDYNGISFDDGTFVARREFKKHKLIVVDPGGSYVLIENYRSAQNVSISLTDEILKHVSGGLGGIPDGDTANDFTLRDGSMMDLDEAGTIEGLYNRFAMSWRVRPKERLFTQGDAKDYLTAEYTEIPHSVIRLSDFSQAEIERAGKSCTDAGVSAGPALEDCTYDVVVTGDPEWAEMASSSEIVASAQPPQAAIGGTQSEQSAQAALLTSVAIEASVSGGSLINKNLQWTIINQSTEEIVSPETQSAMISIDLIPGNYDVLVVSDGYEGESTIEVQVSGSHQFVVELQSQKVQDRFSSPESIPAGELLNFEWKGPAAKDDRIFIAEIDMRESSYRTSNYHKASDGSPAVLVVPPLPGKYELRYYSYANGSVVFRKALEVTDAEVTISAPDELIAGTEINFDWDGPKASDDRLFIAEPKLKPNMYPSSSRRHHKVASGSPANLIVPVRAGDYEIRYYSSNYGHTLASFPIRVLPHSVHINAPRTLTPGKEFEFSWEGPNAKDDFLFICEQKMKKSRFYIGSDRQHRVKDGSTGKLTAPTEPGTYEIRYFSYRNGLMLAKRVLLVR